MRATARLLQSHRPGQEPLRVLSASGQLGYGIPATTFAFADAVALGDTRNAARLRRVISLGSREISDGQEIRFEVRFIGLDVSPLSEALLLWADVPGPQ
mgnify:CR=1 FL=1